MNGTFPLTIEKWENCSLKVILFIGTSVRKTVSVIMEATPAGVNYSRVRDSLLGVPGIRQVQCTVFSVQCSAYSVQCTVFIVKRTVYSFHC